MFRRLKDWWMRRWRPEPEPKLDNMPPGLDDSELRHALQRHLSSTRLVGIHATRSAAALQRLNEILALRARAIENIEAAENALNEINRAGGDDDK